MQRHYGLDWLRIGAFAILILYHVGMVFVPWTYHVKMQVADWVAVPMLASSPWRLTLLFVVSGYASRALLRRHSNALSFMRGRSLRLLVPLGFGVAVIVPPQTWVELVTRHDYPHPYGWFWLHDYFRFAKVDGIRVPALNHLWFVGYLWVYTLLLGLGVFFGHRWGHAIQRGFDRVFAGAAAILLPIAWLLLVDLYLFPGRSETQMLVGDWVAHSVYFPAFLFGFALARSGTILATFARWWAPALAIAVAAYAVDAWLELRWPTHAFPAPYGNLYAGGRAVQGWMTIAALIGIAERFWNRDHRWRPTLTEAVFPFYLIHQTLIVLIGWALLPAGLSMAGNFAVLVIGTVAGCWIFYLVGRRVPILRALIGLRPRVSRAPRIATLALTD